jgi:hypothetical protein
MLKKYILIIIGLIFINTLFAQKGATIRGFIYDENTGEPIIFTNVYLKGTTYGAATDVNGFYSITKVPPGNYTLQVTYLGYDTATASITVKGDEIIEKKLQIKESTVKLKTFDISAEKQELKTQVKMSVTKVTPKEIKNIPSIGGEPDLAQYLQVLPGVIFTGDQGGQLYIRGGSPIQNKVLLDGLIIYNPFHSIGLFSVFDTDIMRNADIYTGGFGAKYGGRISSIMDITTRDGNKKRFGGKISASTFGAKALLEGPLKKAKDLNSGSSSFIISAKTSYLDKTSDMFYKSYFQGVSSENARGIDTSGLPYSFTDIYGKLSFNGGNGSKVNFFGFNFKDDVDYVGVSKLGWNSFGGGSNFVLIPGSSKTLIEGVFAYSSYKIDLDEGDNQPRSSGINGFNAGMDFTYFSGDNEAKYGFEILGFKTDYHFTNSVGRNISQVENTTEMAMYVSYRINAGKMVIEPSFRTHYYASLAQISPEPRIGLKYNITDKLRMKLAGGMYSQNLISANSDRDIVNLFYGFLSGPDNLQDEFTDKNGDVRKVKHNLQKANHAIVGFEYDFTRTFGVNIEGYYKQFKQLTNINRNKIFDDNAENAAIEDYLKKDFIVETGDAYGVDVVFKYDNHFINVWAVYSLSKVTRWDGILEYFPVFDRRHNVNLVTAYKFGKDKNWEFDARWNLGSGFPFTQTQGFFESIQFTNLETDYTSANGDLQIQFADLNKGRLPYYHRLDLSLKRTFILGDNSTLELNASVTNTYNRQNIFYINRITNATVYQLPLMPSFGMSLTF